MPCDTKERTTYPAGHVVHMSIEDAWVTQGERRIVQSVSLARCDCGWENRAGWPGCHAEQDQMIEAHWREIESESPT